VRQQNTQPKQVLFHARAGYGLGALFRPFVRALLLAPGSAALLHGRCPALSEEPKSKRFVPLPATQSRAQHQVGKKSRIPKTYATTTAEFILQLPYERIRLFELARMHLDVLNLTLKVDDTALHR
jgi:hypothetical protein